MQYSTAFMFTISGCLINILDRKYTLMKKIKASTLTFINKNIKTNEFASSYPVRKVKNEKVINIPCPQEVVKKKQQAIC